ncbi:MAG: isopentenyl phosphate kinase family protein [Chloroflexota bacterium]|nr:MAG: isopentenyl phosphate kinase family protein [Chloroflexota bacterium]
MELKQRQLTFLKLGGSLLTDKTGVEALRDDVLRRLADEIKEASDDLPQRSLVLGHGSGSYGHVAAAKLDTRAGVRSKEEWMGFSRVSDAAARLNRFVCGALLDAGLPAISLQPSASAVCENGRIVQLSSEPVTAALKAGLLPVIYGDVAFDVVLGGTIISTEEVMGILAARLKPSRLLLAGETDGVLDQNGAPIPRITRENLPRFESSLKGSRGTDVTGGMSGKVKGVVDLVEGIDGLSVRVFSGLQPGNVRDALSGSSRQMGTLIVRSSGPD